MELLEHGDRRRRKCEEALEVKSLRRIISAYLNYPDASEDDIRHNESSFRKLPPAHKSLLSHLPLKYESLRRCISVNTYFILNMLQAFEPPLDMNMDVDLYDHQLLECCQDEHHHRHDGGFLDSHHGSTGETMSRSIIDPVVSNIENDLMPKSARETTNPEGEQLPVLNCKPERGEVGSGATEPISSQESERQVRAVDSNGNASSFSCDWLNSSLQLNVPLVDVDKVRCIIRNIVRDWALEGQVERDQCYQPILEELERLFPKRSKESPPCCLVPGAGLGRLALDISRLGFVCQGNEFSYYMMICSSFILNHSQSVGEWTIYPWIHSNCNTVSDEDQLRPVSIPDILPASAGITEGFSMCGGDFVEVYSDPGQEGIWDAVVTCFFIDTAHNIVEYIEIIWKILKDGGVWINLGPLLYHFADTYGQNEMSIELSLEDVKKVALHYGFTLERESTISTTYTTNIRSMMQNRYFASFWTMTKKTANKSTEMHDA
ncbi:hypothetical protein SOVF_109770 [Spinacia oleracea]|uniref:carnosine N-methyltransferase n=1 Tax=Spinacia oleracea TaxID=3562 RepID=A0A9R0JSZ6_SPIOL|nr:uncharacterized protein LOC110785351 [Spinacia oleracea]KNA14209.1 hypothetical protein SOVF_109770 [Spinacia oleracea]